MPTAFFEEVEQIDAPGPASSRRATFDDILSIEPPVQTASFDDILSIEPPSRPATMRDRLGVPAGAEPPRIQIQASGVTQPESVRVTQPPPVVYPPLTPPSGGTLGDALVRGYVTPPTGSEPLPAQGIRQAARGVRELAGADVQPATIPSRAGQSEVSFGPLPDRAMAGASDVIEGVFKFATPAVAVALVANPVSTGATLVRAWLGSVVGEKGAEVIGASPEAQRLAGNIGAFAGGITDPIKIADKLASKSKFAQRVAADARAVAEQVRAFDEAQRVSEEPVSVGRGATEAADRARVPEQELVRPAAQPTDIDLILRGPEPIGEAPDTFREPEVPTVPPVVAPPPAVPAEPLGTEAAPASEVPASTQGVPPSDVSPAYAEALQASRVASRAFEEATQRYRAREIGDDEYLAARRAYFESTKAFAAAYDAEQALSEPPPTDLSTPAPEAQNVERGPEIAAAPAGELAPRGADERPAAPPSGLQPPAGNRRRPPVRRPAIEPVADSAVIDDLIARARGGGYTGDDAPLRAELTDRLQLLRDLDREYESSGRNPETLLKAIAAGGGIGEDPTYPGEIKWLRELRDQQASRRIVTSKTGERTVKGRAGQTVVMDSVRGIRGVVRPKTGKTLGGLVEYLRQDPAFQHIETVNDLMDEIRAAATSKPDRAAADALRKGLGEKWWESVQPIAEAGQTLGNIDVLDTGEQQPRLPEAGQVRDVEQATPEFDIPFSLDAEVDRTAREREQDMFSEREPGEDDVLGARQRPPTPPRPAAAPTDKSQLKPSEIVARLSKALNDLPIRVGRFRERAFGIYKVKPQVVRTKVANDLNVLAHEIGHHIDEALVRIRNPQVNAELEKLGGPTSRPSYSAKKRRQEGAAEFVRLYLSDPARLTVDAPNYLAAFETALDAQLELKATLQWARRQYMGYLAQDPVARVKAHLDFTGNEPKPGGSAVTRLRTAWVDDLYPIQRAVDLMADGRPIDILSDAYALARLARGSAGKADGFLEFGPQAADGSSLGPSFEAALQAVGTQLEDFAAYLVADHVTEREAAGKRTGIEVADAQATVAKLKSPAFVKAAAALHDFERGVLEYARQNGAISDAQFTAITNAYQAHVPLYRVEAELEGSGGVIGAASRIANRAAPIKRAKGSGRDIINPLESIVRNTHAIVDMVEKNKALQALAEQATQTTGGGRFLEAIPPPMEVSRLNLERFSKEIRDALKAQGVNVPAGLDLDQIVQVFSPAHFVRGQKGVITVVRNGKPTFYQVNDLALYDAITAIGTKQPSLVTNLFVKPARALRAGATLSIGFVARNPVRDTFTAAVNSRYGFRLGYDTLKGLFEFLRKGDDYRAFLNSGAANAALVSGDRNLIRERLNAMGRTGRRRWLNTGVLNPMTFLRAISEAGENATRLGEFTRGLAQEGRDAEGAARAALAARDVTIDFARGGTLSKEVNRYTAFFNASVQGVARIGEVFAEDPVGATWRAVAAITIPTLALWYLNRDDEEYQQIPDWEKNAYWHIPLGKGRGFARIPKPFELGLIFGTAPAVALDHLYGKDPNVAERLFPNTDSAWDALLSIMPTAIMPVVEVATNYDTFRKRPIISPWDIDLDPALQYNRWTSETAKLIAPRFGLAPAKFDHLVYGYFAGLGRGALEVTDRAVLLARGEKGVRPDRGASAWPGLGAFYASGEPSNNAQSIQDFYDLRDRLRGERASVRRYEVAGNTAEATKLRADLSKTYGGPFEARWGVVVSTEAALKDMGREVNQVYASTISPADKRKRLNGIYERMVHAANLALKRTATGQKLP